jgi:hypothetical protein
MPQICQEAKYGLHKLIVVANMFGILLWYPWPFIDECDTPKLLEQGVLKPWSLAHNKDKRCGEPQLFSNNGNDERLQTSCESFSLGIKAQ